MPAMERVGTGERYLFVHSTNQQTYSINYQIKVSTRVYLDDSVNMCVGLSSTDIKRNLSVIFGHKEAYLRQVQLYFIHRCRSVLNHCDGWRTCGKVINHTKISG